MGRPRVPRRLTAGGDIVAVNAREFSVDALKHAIGCAAEGVPIDLLVKAGTRTRQVTVEYHEGHRYPHLEPINGARRRLDEILAPL